MPVEQKSKSSKKPGLLTRAKNRFLLFTEKKNSAMSVTHKDAMKWFEIRKSGYEELNFSNSTICKSRFNHF